MYGQQHQHGWTPRKPFRGRSGGFIDFANAPTDEIRQHLQSRGLETTGSDGVLRSRLKRGVDQAKHGPGSSSVIEFLVVIDFEACCSDDDLEGCRPKAGTYQQEIIEFPAILVDVKQRKIVDVFHTHVQPTNEENRKLTAFCTKLTGITQEVIDGSPQFPTVLRNFEAWLDKHGLLGQKNWSTAADGRFDHTNFLYQACKINGLPFPAYALNYVKLPRAFKKIYRFCFTDPTSFPPNLDEMLHHFGMKFEGREHCGLDDATNMARCALKMLADGAELRPSERVHPDEVDEERPFSCKVRVLVPEEWLELQKSIRDPTYQPKEVGRGDGRPLEEVQKLIISYNLDSSGSDGVQSSRVALHETWLRYGMENPNVYDYIVALNVEVVPGEKDKEIGSYVQPVIQMSAAILRVAKTEHLAPKFDYYCNASETIVSTQLPGLAGLAQEPVPENRFPEMLQAFESWTKQNGCTHGLNQQNWCLIVNSRQALPFYLYSACATNNIPYPQWALFYTKLDAVFKKFYPACCLQVALPKLKEIVDHFGLKSAGGKSTEIVDDLARTCLQMVKDKVPIQPTEQVFLERPEGPSKPYSRMTGQVQARDWHRMRQAIIVEKSRSDLAF